MYSARGPGKRVIRTTWKGGPDEPRWAGYFALGNPRRVRTALHAACQSGQISHNQCTDVQHGRDPGIRNGVDGQALATASE